MNLKLAGLRKGEISSSVYRSLLKYKVNNYRNFNFIYTDGTKANTAVSAAIAFEYHNFHGLWIRFPVFSKWNGLPCSKPSFTEIL